MNELTLKVLQAKQLNSLLCVVLADTVADVQAAALTLALTDVMKPSPYLAKSHSCTAYPPKFSAQSL